MIGRRNRLVVRRPMIVLLVLAGIAACGGPGAAANAELPPPGPNALRTQPVSRAPATRDSLLRELESAEARWRAQRPTDYWLRVHWEGTPAPSGDSVHIVDVRDGRVVAVRNRTGKVVLEVEGAVFDSMRDPFLGLREAVQTGRAAEVRFDPALGYPTLVSYDWRTEAGERGRLTFRYRVEPPGQVRDDEASPRRPSNDTLKLSSARVEASGWTPVSFQEPWRAPDPRRHNRLQLNVGR